MGNQQNKDKPKNKKFDFDKPNIFAKFKSEEP